MNKRAQTIGIGLVAGIVVGAVVGAITGNVGVWIGIGVALGLVIGAALASRTVEANGDSQQANNSSEKEIARQWAEIERKYPEASRVISYALLHMSSPLPGEDEEFEYTSAHHEWTLKIGHCATALLLALRMPDSCMVDLSKIQPPKPGVVLPPRAQCIRDCMHKNKNKPYKECVCECFPELCFP